MNMATGTTIQPSSRVARSEAILFTELGDTVVMMDTKKGRYYEFDAVAARIWAMIDSAPRVAELGVALAAEYEVDPDACRDDVLTFLDELGGLAIIRVLCSDGEAGGEGGEGVVNDDAAKRAAADLVADIPRRADKVPWTKPTFRVMETKHVMDYGTKPHMYGENPWGYSPLS